MVNEKSEKSEINIQIPEASKISHIKEITELSSFKLENVIISLQPIFKQIVDNSNYIQEYVAKSMQETLVAFADMIKPLIDTVMTQIPKYTPYFKELADSIEKAKKNPDSFINWYNYSEKLSEYLWSIPFDIESKDLKEIFEKINSEKEFDDYMLKYFTKEKTERLFKLIESKLPVKHRLMFKQIKKAFLSHSYSLAIVGIMSIIDELCSYFLIDKGCSGRKDLFEPIIVDLDRRGIDNFTILDIMILSNNINIIYENVEFNGKINIGTHKKARRNPSQHGRAFSNRKVDVLMLLNTMFNLLIIRIEFKEYKNKIHKKKKKFYIPDDKEREKIKMNIKENIDNRKGLIK